jgi:hypothetical protein
MNTLLVLLLVLATYLIASYLSKQYRPKCPPQVVHYTIEVPSVLDAQFSETNLPSKQLPDMFLDGTPWVGGTNIGNAKRVPDMFSNEAQSPA